MADRIEVGYAPAAIVGGLGIKHKYIIYTKDVGVPTEQKFIARGGPGVITEPGTIITESGPYTRDSRDWDPARAPTTDPTHDPNAVPHPRETIIEGDDLSGDWQKIQDVMRDIDDRNIFYDPTDTNSNAAADEALRRAGLPVPTKDGPLDNFFPVCTCHWSVRFARLHADKFYVRTGVRRLSPRSRLASVSA